MANDLVQRIKDIMSDQAFMRTLNGLSGRATFSSELVRQLHRAQDYIPQRVNTLFGMEVHTSHMFPYTIICAECNGTGDGGDESTYCQRCKGGGEVRHVGIIQDRPSIYDTFAYGRALGNTTVIVEYLPRKFEVSFPDDVLVPLRKIPERPTYVLQPAP